MSNKWNRKLRGRKEAFFLGHIDDPCYIGEKCPECKQGELVIRRGRFGEFIGCSEFPVCWYTREIGEPGEELRKNTTRPAAALLVTIKDLDNVGKEHKYIITDTEKSTQVRASAHSALIISRKSPVGNALATHEADDEVAVKTPKGIRRLRITKKEYLEP